MIGQRFSSIIWPLLLILLGAMWLLTNLGLVDTQVLRVFINLWPLLLIALGINILLKPRFPNLGIWIALGTLVLAFALALAAPNLGWSFGPELKEARFEEALGETEIAHVTLDLSIGTSSVSAGEPGGALLETDITYYKDAEFFVEGDENKTVRLRIDNEGLNSAFFNLFSPDPRTDVLLSPDVPLDLVVNGAVGDVEIDLSDLTLRSLEVHGGVGNISIVLPGQSEEYTAAVEGGVGRMRIEIRQGANLRLDISGGVGDFRIDVPKDAPVRLDGDADVGSIRVPSFMQLVTDRSRSVGRSGIWESPAYAEAGETIEIEFRGGVGSLTLR